ncbi:nuclear transport factor 2 family protein [Aeromicrobium wangtongii]|uniref:Nuclear transport factor 2 family protein n=1 Tax=Aeromicrobium wangtongii TaxID=2969247 RepID=A0ABY5MBM3_9ACTN|nr:nuclear transport factor 2 family protein [Aeromicrobium wangtongii]MCD9196976.1 nuclear transport factor 2 family protein [Aeromicrobium wangtongii]UUP14478.1 nuclear transport factor 2 family protein [Aeromicrobium wangtongii]
MEANEEQSIRNLIVRAALVADELPLEAYASVYSDDALVENSAGTVAGITAITEGAEGRRSAGTAGPGSHTRHFVTPLSVDIDGDHATATSYFVVLGKVAEIPTPLVFGVYDDTLARTSAGWRITNRVTRAE